MIDSGSSITNFTQADLRKHVQCGRNRRPTYVQERHMWIMTTNR